MTHLQVLKPWSPLPTRVDVAENTESFRFFERKDGCVAAVLLLMGR